MARATWSGFLSFGLVSIPVGLFTATTDQTIHFNQLHKGTSNRVRYLKTDEETGESLETSDIVNGYPLGDGEYVVVTREELRDAAPGKSELIDIQDFVDLDDIDPKYFHHTYYLSPKGKGSDRAYTLLLQAMRETNKVGIATLVMRDKEHLVAVRPSNDVLILETMYFSDEIRDPKEELETLPRAVHPDTRELKVAKQLINSLTAKWDPKRYKNTYRDRVEALVERKRKGHAIVVNEDDDQPKSNVIDLMSALQQSIDRSSSKQKTSTPKKAPSDVSALTKAELIKEAKQRGVKVGTKATKADLLKALARPKVSKKRTTRAS